MATDSAKSFFDSLSTVSQIQALNGQPEDLYFEAKTCSTPLSDYDKDHLAEALSGFANADGGVLVYGLVTKRKDQNSPDVVTGEKPVSELSKVHSEVVSLIGQVVEPPVENVQVVPRAMERDPSRGFLLVYIPRSDSFLHRSRRDREYYRRHGTGFFRMEHYEIAEFYGRRKNPALTFWWELKINSHEGREPNRIFTVEIIVGVHNGGRGIAKHPAIMIRKVRCETLHGRGVDGSGRTGLPPMPMSEVGATLFAGGNAVVYPGTILEVTVLSEKFRVSETSPSCPDVEIEYELFAEDMESKKGEVQIKGAEVLDKMRNRGLIA